MAEPFKNIYNLELIDAMAECLSRVSPDFDAASFRKLSNDQLDKLEMMARMDQISRALESGLSEDFLRNLTVLNNALHPSKTSELSDMKTDQHGIAGWAIVPLASYVARCGLDEPHSSLDALREMTKRFSAEFAVRFFVRDHQELALSKAHQWALDDNFHVRRLASEGLRPLLPWGIKLHALVEDPAPLLPILKQLRDDPSEYVRKSVANNLNDISKNQPDMIAELAEDWLKDASPNRLKLVRHACRTLIKAGHPATLKAFGFGPPVISGVHLEIPSQVQLGDMMRIEFGFTAEQEQNFLIDYVVHFMRANGKLSPKVFKWTRKHAVVGQSIQLEKSHPYKRVTTRRDYAGQQMLTVQVNGVEVARKCFEFQI